MKLNHLSYFAAWAALVVGGLAILVMCKSDKPDRRAPDEGPVAGITEFELPHGRVLYVTIEESGFYLGDDFVESHQLERYLKDHAAELRPNSAILSGTANARFSQTVEALDSIRSVLKVKVTMNTKTIAPGTRRGPIEVHQNSWEYE